MAEKKLSKLIEQAEELAKLTFLLARACEDKEQYFTKLYNLTHPEFRCMRFLKDSCFLSVKQLASEMRLSQGRLTQILTSLEVKGFITREIDKNDRRNIIITTTKIAEPYIKNVIDKHNELHENVLKLISEKDRDNVLKAMNELLNSLMSWSQSNVSDTNKNKVKNEKTN